MLANPITAQPRATYGQIAQTVLINCNVIHAQWEKLYSTATGIFPETVGFSTLQAWKHFHLPILAGPSKTMTTGQLGVEAEEVQAEKATRNDLPLLNITPQNRRYFSFADVRYLLDKARLWGRDDCGPPPPSCSHLSRQSCCSFLRPHISLPASPSQPYSLALDHTHITSCQCHPIVTSLKKRRLLRWGPARCHSLRRRIQEGNLTAVSASSRLISLVHRLFHLFPGFTRETVTLGYFCILEWNWLAEAAVFVTEKFGGAGRCARQQVFLPVGTAGDALIQLEFVLTVFERLYRAAAYFWAQC